MTEAVATSAATRDELVGLVPELRAFALSLSRNPSVADDLVQETVLKAWAKLDSFEPGTNMRAWLFTILRNTFYSDARKGKREVADVDGAYAARLSQKPDHDGRLALRDFAVAFATLPDDQRGGADPGRRPRGSRMKRPPGPAAVRSARSRAGSNTRTRAACP